MEEIVHYGDGHTWVTNDRVIFGQRQYRLSNIQSLERFTFRSDRDGWLFLASSFIAVPAIAVIVLRSDTGSLFPDYLKFACLALILVGVVSTLIYYFFINKHVYIHAIRLHGSFGTAIVCASLDTSYTQRIAGLIETVIGSAYPNQRSLTPVGSERAELSRMQMTQPRATYYVDGVVEITSEWTQLGERTYRTSDIKKVQAQQVRIDRYWWSQHVFQSIMLVSLAANPLTSGQPSNVRLLSATIALFVMIGTIAFLVGTLLKLRYVNLVKLRGTFGRDVGFASLDNAYTDTIVNAIRSAIRDKSQSAIASSVGTGTSTPTQA